MTAPASAVYYLAHHLPPFSADRIVFGDWEASEPPRGLQGPKRECREHEVTWRGDEPCWLCVESISFTIDNEVAVNGA